MIQLYFISFVFAFFIALSGAWWISSLAKRKQIVDFPDSERRFHDKPTPTLGGIAIFGSFFTVTLLVGILGGYLLNGNIPLKLLIGIWVSGAVLIIGGYFDDRYHLPPKFSILFPVLASIIIVTSGIKTVSIHNPFNGNVLLVSSLLSSIIVFAWTMTMTYTTKLLDGMDGLVSGISTIAAVVLFGISLTPEVMQPQTALLAIIFAGSLLGFLMLNFHPAKIFLGEGGSTLTGFMLAVFAIVSGGKIATALLVMGIPLLDMIWVIIQRLVNHQSPFSGDRKHLHFQLTSLGFSQSQTVLLLYMLTAIFGLSALFLQSKGKFFALILLFVVMLAVFASVYTAFKHKKHG